MREIPKRITARFRRLMPLLLAFGLATGTVMTVQVAASTPAHAMTVGTNDYPYASYDGPGSDPSTYTWYNPSGTSYLSPLRFAYRNCTDYAAYEINEQMGGSNSNIKFNWSNINVGGDGNARAWKQGAINMGKTVDNTPAVGSVAWWGTEEGGGYGHVAIVSGVSNNGSTITISDYNSGQGGWGNYASYSLTVGSSSNYIAWPDNFLHIADTSSSGGGDSGYEVALQGAGNQHLWMFGTAGEFDGTLGVQDGTSPSIAALSGGGYELALQGTGTQHLWVSGTSGEFDTQLGVQSGTSPSIAGLSGGGYEVAFVASGTQHLYMFGSAGEFDTQLTVQSGSSPSITGLPNNGYEVAFVGAGSGHLWMFGTVGEFDTQMGVQPNTSPSVAGLVGGGYQVALQGAGNQDLWVFGSSGQFNTQQAIQLGTSPSITGLPNGGYEIAFQGAGNQHLWLYGSAGSFDTGLGVQSGTSPSIGTLSSSTSTTSNYEVAFVASGTQDLYLFGNDGEFDGQLGIQTGTSPSIAGLLK